MRSKLKLFVAAAALAAFAAGLVFKAWPAGDTVIGEFETGFYGEKLVFNKTGTRLYITDRYKDAVRAFRVDPGPAFTQIAVIPTGTTKSPAAGASSRARRRTRASTSARAATACRRRTRAASPSATTASRSATRPS